MRGKVGAAFAVLVILAGCASTQPASENWQDAPNTSHQYVVVVSMPNSTLTLTLGEGGIKIDSSGDISGQGEATQTASPEQTTTVEPEVTIPATGVP